MQNSDRKTDSSYFHEKFPFLKQSNDNSQTPCIKFIQNNNLTGLIQPIAQKKSYQKSFTYTKNSSALDHSSHKKKKYIGFRPVINRPIQANPHLSTNRFRQRSMLNFDRINDSAKFAPINSSFRVINRKSSIDKYDEKKNMNEEFNYPKFNQIKLESTDNLSSSFYKHNLMDLKKCNNSMIFDAKEDKSLKGPSFMEIYQEKKSEYEGQGKDKNGCFINETHCEDKYCFQEKQNIFYLNQNIQNNKICSHNEINFLKNSTSLQDLDSKYTFEKKMPNENIQEMLNSRESVSKLVMNTSRNIYTNKCIPSFGLLNKRGNHKFILENLDNNISFEKNFKLIKKNKLHKKPMITQSQYFPVSLEKKNKSFTSLEGTIK